MDIGTLVAAIVATVLTLGALFCWGDWQDDENLNGLYWFGTVLAAVIAFIWTWSTGFHWNTVVAFVWPYATGYIWAWVIANNALKQRNMLIIPFALLVTILGLGALLAVTDVTRPFLVLFSIPYNIGPVHLPINGYALWGCSGLVLTVVLSVSLPLARERKKGEAISNEALRLAIIQRLNQGRTVTKADFRYVDMVRIQNVMAALEGEFADLAFIYDSIAPTIAYRNAEGVHRIYDTYQIPMNKSSASTLVQAFFKELGLSEAPVDIPLQDTSFYLALVQAGNLTSVLPDTFPVFVPMLTEQQIREEDVRSVFQKRFNDENPEKRFAVILSPNNSALLRNLLTQPDRGGIRENIVFLDEENMRAIIASKKSDARVPFMNLVRKNVKLTKVSPFITEGPTRGLVFVGRERGISTVLETIKSHSYIIVGGRRIGKTSILHQIMLRLHRQEYSVLFLECSAISNYQEFYRTIATEWKTELGKYERADDLPVTFREIVAVLSSNNSTKLPLVFVLDEIDGLLQFDKQQENSEKLFRTFRDLSQTLRCQFIFSGERHIFQQRKQSKSPLFNFCENIELKLLSQDDARKLIEEPFSLLNIPIAEGRILVDFMTDACSYHPNLIQQMCRDILLLLEEQDQILQPMITQQIVEQVVSQPEFKQRYLDVFWGQSTKWEKAITSLVQTDELVQPVDIAHRLQQHGFNLTQEELDIALAYLQFYCIFQYDKDGIRWTATHFKEFLEQTIIDLEDFLNNLRDNG